MPVSGPSTAVPSFRACFASTLRSSVPSSYGTSDVYEVFWVLVRSPVLMYALYMDADMPSFVPALEGCSNPPPPAACMTPWQLPHHSDIPEPYATRTSFARSLWL